MQSFSSVSSSTKNNKQKKLKASALSTSGIPQSSWFNPDELSSQNLTSSFDLANDQARIIKQLNTREKLEISDIKSNPLQSNLIQSTSLKVDHTQEEEPDLLSDYLHYLVDSLMEIYYEPLALWIEFNHNLIDKKDLKNLQRKIKQGHEIDHYFITLSLNILNFICHKMEEPTDEVAKLAQFEKISYNHSQNLKTDASRTLELQSRLDLIKKESIENTENFYGEMQHKNLDIKHQIDHLKTLGKAKKMDVTQGFADYSKLLLKESSRLEAPLYKEGMNSFMVSLDIFSAKNKTLYQVAHLISEQLNRVMNQAISELSETRNKEKNLEKIAQYTDKIFFIAKRIGSMRYFISLKQKKLTENLGNNLLENIDKNSTDQNELIDKFNKLHEALVKRNTESFNKLVLMKEKEIAQFSAEKANELNLKILSNKQKILNIKKHNFEEDCKKIRS